MKSRVFFWNIIVFTKAQSWQVQTDKIILILQLSTLSNFWYKAKQRSPQIPPRLSFSITFLHYIPDWLVTRYDCSLQDSACSACHMWRQLPPASSCLYVGLVVLTTNLCQPAQAERASCVYNLPRFIISPCSEIINYQKLPQHWQSALDQ